MEMDEPVASSFRRADHCSCASRRLLDRKCFFSFLNGRSQDDLLKQKGWTSTDLDLHLRRPEALRRFAHQRFGPGIEERFPSPRALVIKSSTPC